MLEVLRYRRLKLYKLHMPKASDTCYKTHVSYKNVFSIIKQLNTFPKHLSNTFP